MSYRDDESEGFSRAGLGGAEDVATTQRVGQRRALDLAHLGVLGRQPVLGLLGEGKMAEELAAGVRREAATGDPTDWGGGGRRGGGEGVGARIGFHGLDP